VSEKTVTVRLSQHRDYQFDAEFGGAAPLLRTDEAPPLGQGAGPTPVQLLAAAVGNCLADSMLFALRKFKQQPEPIGCEVSAEVGRNAEGRLRVTAMTATLTLGVPADALEHLDRVLAQFEAFCTVKQTIAQAVPITTRVFDARGAQLK
jgi:uncharacterized OsmC-like protein